MTTEMKALIGVFVLMVGLLYTSWDVRVREIEANKQKSIIEHQVRHEEWIKWWNEQTKGGEAKLPPHTSIKPSPASK